MEHKWCKVLIVDDELLIRQGIKHSIHWEQEGFQIVGEASNGKEALDLIKEKHPHIVITDMVMPIMDGEQLTRTIKEEYPTVEVIILSSFSDFDYVRATFQQGVSDYILKPQLEGEVLLKALQQAVDRMPNFTLSPHHSNDANALMDHTIEKVLTGYEVDEDISVIEAVFPHQHYCLLCIDFNSRTTKETYDSRALTTKIKQELTNAFSDVFVKKIATHEQSVVFLFNFKPNQFQVIKQFVTEISTSSSFEDVDMGWILTRTFINFYELKEIYENDLQALLHYRFYLPQMKVIICGELSDVKQITEPFQLAHFTDLCKRNKFDAAFSYLESHVNELIHQYRTDEFIFKSFLGNTIFNIIVLLGNMDYDTEVLEQQKYTYMTSIDESINVEETLSLLQSFLNQVKSIIKNTVIDPHYPKMQELFQYIDQHYAEPLNLSDVAKHFHYNPSYLSNYFSENSTLGFSEYVNKVRIEKSVELLEKSVESIAEISILVGYADQSYFGKVFKGFMGTSPSKYRRQYFRARKKET